MSRITKTVRRYFTLLPILAVAVLPLEGSKEASAQAPKLDTWEDLAFRIEDSKTRVGIASVNLSVSELKPINGELIGYYEIEVPLMSSKNDSGRIVLPLDQSVKDLGKKGGVLKGTAYSEKNKDQLNKIVCEIKPLDKKAIFLAITTPDRTLHFESKYTVIESGNGG